MPWKVFEIDDRYCVYKIDENDQAIGEALQCYDEPGPADAYVRALYANEPELGEAATLKSQAQRLMRDVETILKDKSLPESLRKEIEDVRLALRRTWADLAADQEETMSVDFIPVTQTLIETLRQLVDEFMISEGDDSLEQRASAIKNAFRAKYPGGDSIGYDRMPWPRDVLEGHSSLGDSLVVEYEGKLYAVEYSQAGDGFEFSARPEWTPVVMSYSTAQDMTAESDDDLVELSESLAGIVDLSEVDQATDLTPARSPLSMTVRLIQPGWGNKRDGHYYPADVLRRDASIFEGAKMYRTDHRPDEKSERTEVSVVDKIVSFDEGAPIARVTVFDPDFAEKVRTRKAADKLDTLECSILAKGRAKKGEIDGREAKIVESIDEAVSVDWVTRAGAGGQARDVLQENEQEEAQPMQDNKPDQAQPDETQVEEVDIEETDIEETDVTEPTFLSEQEVADFLDKRRLPAVVRERLGAGQYQDETGLQEAIDEEVAYVKQLTRSGQPFGQGESTASPPKSFEEVEQQSLDRFNRIMREIGATQV